MHRLLVALLPPLAAAVVWRRLVRVNPCLDALLRPRAALRLPHLLFAVRFTDVLTVRERVPPQPPPFAVRVLFARPARLELERLAIAWLLAGAALVVLLPLFARPRFIDVPKEVLGKGLLKRAAATGGRPRTWPGLKGWRL